MRRIQGLPLNTIVLAAIAIFVLLLIIGFSSGTLGKLFKGFGQQTATVTLDSARIECQRLCTDLRTQFDGKVYEDWMENVIKNHPYVKRQFKIEGYGDALNCWDNPINVVCSVTLYKADGSIEKKCEVDGDEFICYSINT